MGTLSFTVSLLVTVLVFSGFFFAWRWANSKASQAELEATAAGSASYSQTGGSRLNTFNATIPFATIVVTPTEIILSVLGRQHRFEKSSVRSLAKHRALFSTGLRIEHESSAAPSFVVFWATNFDKLAGSLERFGWSVTR